MNTISRPRKRPRRRSCNFRSLWWLVRMEAMVRITWPYMAEMPDPLARRLLLSRPPSTRLGRAYRVLELNDSRRYYP